MAVSRTSAVDHAAHDELILAAYASGDDLPAAERVATDALVRDCPDCAALVVDLRLIRAATVALPVPPRRRDFRLTDEDAARLRPAGWRRLVATFASARLAFTAPLGAGLVAIGVVAGLVTVVPGAGGPIFTNVSGNLSTSLSRDVSAADSFSLVSPAAAGAAAAPELAPAPSGVSDLTVTSTSSAAAPAGGGPAAAQPASPPADVASGATAPVPSGADAKLPGDVAALAPAPDASASAGDAAPLTPAPDASASAVDSRAIAPLAGASAGADAAAITRDQTPAGEIGPGGAEAPAPASQPAVIAPTGPDAGAGTTGTTWLAIASLILTAAGILLLGLRYVAIRVAFR